MLSLSPISKKKATTFANSQKKSMVEAWKKAKLDKDLGKKEAL